MTIKDEAGPQTPPAVGEFAVSERQQLLARIDAQAREIERLKDCLQDCRASKEAFANNAISLQNRIAALKAQLDGVALPEYDETRTSHNVDEAYQNGWNACLDEVARLNSSPVSAVCDTCHGQGEVWTGENQSFGYMSMQPPEPIMEACPECSGELVRPASAGDDRKLSDIGNELHNLSCHVVHHNESWANQLGTLASELWYWPSNAGVVDERAAFEVFVRSDAWMFAPDLTRNPATEDYWDVEEQTGWISWQARSALTASAPSHSEQVREVVPEYTSAMGEAAQQYIDECCRGSDGELLITPPRMPGTFFWYELYARMLAAAPSAGSQQGGE